MYGNLFVGYPVVLTRVSVSVYLPEAVISLCMPRSFSHPTQIPQIFTSSATMQRNSSNRGRNGSSQIGEYDAEQMSLLADDDEQDQSWTDDQPCPPNPHSNLPVYNTIHR